MRILYHTNCPSNMRARPEVKNKLALRAIGKRPRGVKSKLTNSKSANILIQVENMPHMILVKLHKIFRLIFLSHKIGYLHTSCDSCQYCTIYVFTHDLNYTIYLKDSGQYLALNRLFNICVFPLFLMLPCIMSNSQTLPLL